MVRSIEKEKKLKKVREKGIKRSRDSGAKEGKKLEKKVEKKAVKKSEDTKVKKPQESKKPQEPKKPKKLKEPTTMGELLEQEEYEIRSLRYGQLVEGTVIHKGKRELLVELGAKSEGIITGSELEDPDDTFRKIEVGQKILSSVVQAENDGNRTAQFSRHTSKPNHDAIQTQIANCLVVFCHSSPYHPSKCTNPAWDYLLKLYFL